MSGEMLTIDEREQRLIADERLIGQIRARQMRDLAALDAAQTATGDGCRSLSEWVAARLDVSLDSARSLVRTMLTTTTTSRRQARPQTPGAPSALLGMPS